MTNETNATTNAANEAAAQSTEQERHPGRNRAVLVNEIGQQSVAFLTEVTDVLDKIKDDDNLTADQSARLEGVVADVLMSRAGLEILQRELGQARAVMTLVLALLEGTMGILKAENIKMDTVTLTLTDENGEPDENEIDPAIVIREAQQIVGDGDIATTHVARTREASEDEAA